MESTSTRGISALILAAGANTRLNTIVPPYLKPLVLVDGKPLIVHAYDHARVDWHVSQTIAVVSPDNAKLITHFLGKDVDYVIQPEPHGVIDAIHRGIGLVMQPWTLILCADNTFSKGDEAEMPWESYHHKAAFGARYDIKWPENKRFTRFEEMPTIERINFHDASTDVRGTGCWIGPLLLDTRRIAANLRHADGIVKLIEDCTGGDIEPLHMRCSDLGIPEELRERREAK